MIEVGDIVEVEVQSVHVFGIYCRHDSQDVLVLIPEVSWIASFCSCEQFTEPGEHLTVIITVVDAKSGKIAASLKDLHPDPWETDQLRVGKQYDARVVRYVPESDRCDGNPGYLLELLPGAYAMLCADGLSLGPNQQYLVTIQESTFSKRAVRIERSQLSN